MKPPRAPEEFKLPGVHKYRHLPSLEIVSKRAPSLFNESGAHAEEIEERPSKPMTSTPQSKVELTKTTNFERSVSLLPLKRVEVTQLVRSQVKEWIWWHWLEVCWAPLGLKPVQPSSTYKYYVGKGNNSPLINQVIKTRWWWARIEQPQLANLVWTQYRHSRTIKRINRQALSSSEKLGFTVYMPKAPRQLITEQVHHMNIGRIQKSGAYRRKAEEESYDPMKLCIHNRLKNNILLSAKKRLLKYMKSYYEAEGTDPFTVLPLSFHIVKSENSQMEEFMNYYVPGSTWIIKPGENTNRGYGIRVSSSLSEIQAMLENAEPGRSYIVQKYIMNPLLVHKRKFDIRCFGLLTNFNQVVQGYFFKEGYIRTATKEFSHKKLNDKFVHLTNDAIQKQSEDYGKFELGNKMSYCEFQRYLAMQRPGTDFYTDIIPKLEKIVADSFKAVQPHLQDSNWAFELFGYDLMLDENLNVWLIEVNTNPCLELSCSYLAKLLPEVIENAFRLTIDPLFPPPPENKKFKHWVQDCSLKNQFSLVFSS